MSAVYILNKNRSQARNPRFTEIAHLCINVTNVSSIAFQKRPEQDFDKDPRVELETRPASAPKSVSYPDGLVCLIRLPLPPESD